MTVKGPDNEDYEVFFLDWVEKQKEQIEELQEALGMGETEDVLKELVAKVMKHYDLYYESKDSAARQNILQTIVPSWKTSLEKAFMWIGGWRPTILFQLAYAQSGQKLEEELANILEGIEVQSMAGISARQLELIDNLQRETQVEEEKLSHKMALIQQGMADQPLLGLAEKVENLLRDSDETDVTVPLESEVDNKLSVLEELLIDADKLRKNTFLKMLQILTTVQSAEYLAAAAQLQIALRKVGEVQDGKIK